MGKNKLSSGLINVVTYDTNSNISLNSGSNLLMSLSGSGTVTIPGNLVVLGGISGSTAESASYSLNADKIDNLDSTQLVLTSSFNSYTSSASSSLGSLSGSVATTTLNLSSSVSSSIGDLSGSVVTTTSGLSSSIGSLSSSVATTTSGLSSSVSSSIGSLSSSVATTTSGLGGRITTIEGNYATTGSNIFVGSQVITGSLYITNDMVVQGCSCLQNITASAVSIGTNTVVLNTATPAVRFAGISVQDSGSNVGVTGSIYWDGLCNRWVYSNPSDIGYSGGMLLSGPRTSTLGSESPLTCNYIAKSGGGDHLYDSCIIDDGTTVCVNANLKGSGTIDGTIINSTSNAFRFSGNNAISLVALNAQNIVKINAAGYWGTQLVGANDKGILIDNVGNIGIGTTSTAVHNNAGYTTLTIAGGNVNRGWLEIGTLGACTNNIVGNISAFAGTNARISEISFSTEGAANLGNISFSTYCNGINTKLLISNSGISCFACQVCAPKFIATHLAATCLTLNGFSSGNGFKMDYGNASGQITAINLMANGTTNGLIGIQMVDGSNGDLWFGSSNNRSMTIYRTGNHGFNVNAPCTKVHVEGSHGTTWGGNSCFYGGGVAGGGFPFGDEYGNGAAYTYQTANTSQSNLSLGLAGGFAAGYFKGGGGGNYGGGGAGIVAIGGNGANSESVNSGGGAGIFARGGKNGAGSLHSYAGWFDGGNVMIRCGFLGVNNTAPRTFVHIVGASCGADVACGFGNADSRGTLHVEACSGFDNSNITVENAYGIGQFMQWTSNGMRIGHRILKGGGTGDVHMTAGQDSVKLLIYTTGNIGAPSGSNIYAASDCRLKKNIRTISYGLCDVMKLQPKIFNWKDNFTPSENGKEMLGFVAQDIQTIIPEVVEQFSDGSDITFDCETISNPLRVNEKFIIPILTKAIQEQQCMIDTLKSCLGIS